MSLLKKASGDYRVFASVWRKENSLRQNWLAHQALKNFLNNKGIRWEECIASDEDVQELCVSCLATWYQAHILANFCCEEYYQDAILVVDVASPIGGATQLWKTCSPAKFGVPSIEYLDTKLVAVSLSEAVMEGGWVLWNGQYWTLR